MHRNQPAAAGLLGRRACTVWYTCMGGLVDHSRWAGPHCHAQPGCLPASHGGKGALVNATGKETWRAASTHAALQPTPVCTCALEGAWRKLCCIAARHASSHVSRAEAGVGPRGACSLCTCPCRRLACTCHIPLGFAVHSQGKTPNVCAWGCPAFPIPACREGRGGPGMNHRQKPVCVRQCAPPIT